MNKQINRAEPTSIRYSITGKLNTKLFFRLLGIFISLNIIIVIITGACLAVYCERKTREALETLYYSGQADDTGGSYEYSGVDIREISEMTITSGADWTFLKRLPYVTQAAVRGFRAEGYDFEGTVSSITYVVNVGVNDKLYEMTLLIGPFVLYFIYAFAALHVYELFKLISRSAKDRKMVRRTLDPISELARAAQSLNDVNRQLDHDKMMALAGKLDGIDGNRLDTRIQVDDLQEELKNVAVAINGMLDRINESYAAQARFVSDASHELRTPISVIQGYAGLLDRWGKEDEKTLLESIAAIKDEAENMKDLVEQLLFLARGDSNTIRLDEEIIELSELVTEVTGESRMLDDRHNFKVKAEKCNISGDRALIKQALRILVDNAVKYTDPGGEITVSAATADGKARLSVTDNGIGIRPEIIPHVFDRFVRADESRARKTGGAGLGLSIAQWIAVRHNGHIEALSREGIGTRISLVLPAAPEKPVEPAQNIEDNLVL